MKWDNIPQELKSNGLWCVWRISEKGKLPVNPLTGQLARSNDPKSFTSYNEALSVLDDYYGFDENGKQVGGLGLGIFNGFSAIDIDHCVVDGKPSDMAQEIIDFFQSYTEISPSKEGIRIIFKTDYILDKEKFYINNRKIGLEVYISNNTNKYVTITGNVIYPSEIAKVDITYIMNKYMRKQVATGSISGKPVNVDITTFLDKDTKLYELWNAVAPGSGGEESELDLALCSKLAFYMRNDFDLINEAFQASPYFKSKDEKHYKKWIERNDYRKMTIDKAINTTTQVYNPNYNRTYMTNDTGNARMFIDKFGENVRYNVDNKQWQIWNGKYWQHDSFGMIKNYVEIVLEHLKQKAIIVEDESLRKEMLKNIKRAFNSSGKEAMLREAQHIEGIPVMNNDFDKDDYLLNTKSGIVNLRTGDVIKHEKQAMCSKYVDSEVSFDEPKKWLKFLREIFDDNEDMIHYLRKALGYSLTGSTREQCMFIMVGEGSNGKSVLLDIMEATMGSYGSTSEVDILLEKRNNTANLGDVARLNGIRHVITSESQTGDRLNESKIKTMTSGLDTIVARFLYGNEFEFKPKFKIWLATNHKPIIRGTDHGLWRRLKIIPFGVIIPDEKQDKDLAFKLKTELPQILGWLIKGCLLWQKEGLKNIPQIDDNIREYRSEMDIVQRWIEDNCEIKDSYSATASELFKDFTEYVTENKEYQLSNTLFGRNLGKKFEKRRIGGSVNYLGIKLRWKK